jgi:hypothetical protein
MSTSVVSTIPATTTTTTTTTRAVTTSTYLLNRVLTTYHGTTIISPQARLPPTDESITQLNNAYELNPTVAEPTQLEDLSPDNTFGWLNIVLIVCLCSTITLVLIMFIIPLRRCVRRRRALNALRGDIEMSPMSVSNRIYNDSADM